MMGRRAGEMASLVGLWVLLAPGEGAAAGFWEIDRGSSTLARGGANFAAAKDPTAVYLNPAALSGLRGLQVMLDGNMGWDSRSFARADTSARGTSLSFEEVTNRWSDGPSPGAFASYNFASLGARKFTLAGGIYGPTRIYRNWPGDGPQRYSEVRYEPFERHIILGAAYELPWWKTRVGMSGMMIQQTMKNTLALQLDAWGSVPEDERYDVQVAIDARDDWIPNALVGATVEPLPWLVFSLAHQLAYRVHATGTADVTLGAGLQPRGGAASLVSGNKMAMSLRLPSVTRASMQVKDPAGRFDAEVAFVWEDWQKRTSGDKEDAIELIPQDITVGGAPLAPIEIDPHWRDTWSVRVGGAWRLSNALRVRAGTYYERAAIGERDLNVGMFDLNKVGVSLGSRLAVGGGFWVDVAGAYAYWLKREVGNSRVYLEDPLDRSKTLWPVGNGTYGNTQLFVMAAVGAAFSL